MGHREPSHKTDNGKTPDSDRRSKEGELTLQGWLADQAEGRKWTEWLLRIWGVLAAISTAIAVLAVLTGGGGASAGRVILALVLAPFVITPALMLAIAGLISIYGALRALFQPTRYSPGFAVLMGALGSLVLGLVIVYVVTQTGGASGGLVRQEVVQPVPGAYSSQWTASGYGGGSGGEMCVALPLCVAFLLCMVSTALAARRLARRRRPPP